MASLTAVVVGQPALARRLRAMLRDRPEASDLQLRSVPSVASVRLRAPADESTCLLVPADAVASVGAAVPEVALIAMVGDDDLRIATTALDAGAEDCLHEGSVHPAQLLRAVRFALARHRAHADLRRRALHDALTSLPNRVLLFDRLEHALAGMRRSGRQVAVLFADLDGFKAINDRVGHHAGDAVLVVTARRLLAVARPGDTVARLGGDEFAVICEDAGEAELVAIEKRFAHALTRPILVDGERLRVGASIGWAIARTGRESVASVLRRADAAMYDTKRRGRKSPGNRRIAKIHPNLRGAINPTATARTSIVLAGTERRDPE